MRIGEVARRSGVPVTTLRYYETIGLIEPPPRRNGQRDYSVAILDVLKIIRAGQGVGFSLDEIRTLLNQQPERARELWQQLARQKQTQIQGEIQRYQVMLDRLEQSEACMCDDLRQCQLIG